MNKIHHNNFNCENIMENNEPLILTNNDNDDDYGNEEDRYLSQDEENSVQTQPKGSSQGNDEEICNHQNIPEDKYNCNYLVFYILGMTTLLPWNFFITAEDYWLFKFRNVTNVNATDLTPIQKSFTSDLSISASIPGTIFLIINAIIGNSISLSLKMIGSMLGILWLFLITTIFVEIKTDEWQMGFFILTIVTVVIMNSFSALLSGGLFGIAGLFPSEYMTAVVSGQALGGIFTALAMIISLTFGMEPETTALVYFNIGNFVLFISIGAYVLISRTSFFRYYVKETETKTKKTKRRNHRTESMETLTEENDESGSSSQQTDTPELMIILRKIYLYALAEFSVFAVTLSIYPAITVLVQSQYHGNGHPWNDIYFVPVANYLVFNSGDYLGRILAGVFEKPRNKPSIIIAMTIIRMCFIPILMMANLNTTHSFLPVILRSDIVFICVMLIFAITNGYIANISLILAPKIVMQHEKQLASSIMAACLGLGLTTGSAVSLILVQIL